METFEALEIKIERVLSAQHALISEPIPPVPLFDQSTAKRTEPNIKIDSKREYAGSKRRLSVPHSGPSRFASSPFPAATAPNASPASHNHQIESRKLLAWPAVRSLLQDDLASVPNWSIEEEGGEKWLTRITKTYASPLPLDEPANLVFINGGSAALWDSRTIYLTKSIIEELCHAYFRCFYSMYPILDRGYFYEITLPQAYSCSFDPYDEASTKVLLVLTLGAVAQEGQHGNPIFEENTGRKTGIRGGTTERPPGLQFLNEARKRIGLTMAKYNINTLQCFILFS